MHACFLKKNETAIRNMKILKGEDYYGNGIKWDWKKKCGPMNRGGPMGGRCGPMRGGRCGPMRGSCGPQQATQPVVV